MQGMVLVAPVIELSLIGIGTGNPDHLTRQAVKALNAGLEQPGEGRQSRQRTCL